MRRNALWLVVLLTAVCMVGMTAISPVAASDEGFDVDDDGISVGGDDGISIGEDGISVGGDDGVDVDVDTDGVNASVGGDDGIAVGAETDGVDASVGGDDSVGVEAGTDGAGVQAGGVEISDDGASVGDQDLAPDESDVGDEFDIGDGIDLGDDGEGDGDFADDVDVPTHPTDLTHSSDDIPEELRVVNQVLTNAPRTDEVGPEDLPIGDERADINVCEPLAIDGSDLPTEALPGLDDLPEEAQPPGVPTDIVTTEAVVAIALGLAPEPCEIQTPNDPSVDPTDLPDEPAYDLEVQRFGQWEDGGVAVIQYDGTLNESDDGPSLSTLFGNGATSEFGDFDNHLIVNDGNNDYGIDTRSRYNDERVNTEAVLVLYGKNAGIAGECDRLSASDEAFEPDLEENPLGPCEYELVGLPNLIGPEDIVGILLDPDL